MAKEIKQIGKYRILGELGRGRFGLVYKAQHFFFTNRIVAIKLMQNTGFASTQEKEQFLQEARLLEQLKHPYILPVVDIDIHDGSPYLVTDYAPNGTLADRLKRRTTAPLTEQEILTILSQIGQAIQYAHQQQPAIVHRDIKPENILFNAKGEALLADFGIAAILATSGTRVIGPGGTPYYMAPEQFEGMISTKSDQYALGCVAYELFTGQRPFQPPYPSIEIMWYQHAKVNPTTPTQLNPSLSHDKEQAILKAMAKQRTDRHSDVEAFFVALTIQPKKILHLDVGQLTDSGRIQLHNEDAMAHVIPKDPAVLEKQGAMFIVSDGLDERLAGEVASEIAVDTMSKVYYQVDTDDVYNQLIASVKRTNALIYQRATENMQRAGMGASCTIAIVRKSTIYVANVGNSRAYLIHNKQVKQLSQDDVLGNQLIRWLGAQPDVQVGLAWETLYTGDRIVLCTRGLWQTVNEDEIRTIVVQYSPQESVYHLVERANTYGGYNNITAIVIQIIEAG